MLFYLPSDTDGPAVSIHADSISRYDPEETSFLMQ